MKASCTIKYTISVIENLFEWILLNSLLLHTTQYTQNNQWLDNLAYRRLAVEIPVLNLKSQEYISMSVEEPRLRPLTTVLYRACLKLRRSKSINKLLLVAREACYLGLDLKALMHPHLTENLMRLVHVTEHVQAPRDALGISCWGSR